MKVTTGLARISALVLGAVLAVTGTATASAQEATDEVGSQVTSFGVGDWVNLGVRLALVVAVIWAAVHAMRWYVRRMNRAGSRGGIRALEVLETHTLGPNRTLHLVRLGDRAVLVGATQERITQLLTVEDPEEFQRLMDTPDDEDEITTVTRTAPGLSVFSALRTGLMAMRANQAQMSARIKAQREAQREAQRDAEREAREAREERLAARTKAGTTRRATTRPAATRAASMRPAARPVEPEFDDFEDDDEPVAAREPRFGALKGVLGRSQRPAPRTSEEIIAAAAEERESLFDRALASIDAIEITQNGANGSTAAGARARASYGSARSDAARQGRNPMPQESGRSREAQMADLQRAIAQARKTAS